MFFSKLNAMSVGPIWVWRSQTSAKVDCCSNCGEPWVQFNAEINSVLVVLAEPMTNDAQQKLLENCLSAAGWNPHSHCFSLHASCSSNSTIVLQEYIVKHAPELLIVFGRDAAQLLSPEFISGEIHSFENTRLIVTHHPEEMMNNPALKAQVWADLCLGVVQQ